MKGLYHLPLGIFILLKSSSVKSVYWDFNLVLTVVNLSSVDILLNPSTSLFLNEISLVLPLTLTSRGLDNSPAPAFWVYNFFPATFLPIPVTAFNPLANNLQSFIVNSSPDITLPKAVREVPNPNAVNALRSIGAAVFIALVTLAPLAIVPNPGINVAASIPRFSIKFPVSLHDQSSSRL